MVESLRGRASAAAQRWHPGARIADVEPLTGGSSSLTFVASVEDGPPGDEVLVLKVAPPGLPPVRNRDVLRQGRVMRALHGAGVVVPRVLFDDAGDPPEVPPFVAMGFVPGTSVEPVLVEERDPAGFPEIWARALDAATVLAAIHRVDVARAGLGDEERVALVDEVDRWTRAFATVPSDLQGDYERCADALVAAPPEPLAPVVNHGDYRLGNTLGQDGRVTAVIDWEIWSIGDPRVDVAWFTFFTDEAGHPAASSSGPSGTPTAAELLDAYAAAGGAPLADLRWFDALTRYKEAAATALLIKRARRSGALPPGLERMVPALPRLLDEARSLLGAAGSTGRAQGHEARR
jgi:aminoglycoside phosphotransferase (APT) family kinase protein